MDRLDYVDDVQRHAYVPRSKGCSASIPRGAAHRVMFDDTRLNHPMFGAHGLDIGAINVLLSPRRGPDGRYEAVSGTRMHATYY